MTLLRFKTAYLCSVTAALLALACGGDDNNEVTGFDGVDVQLPPPEPFAVTGVDACFVDSECSADTFCFQGHCVFECTSDASCSGDGVCSARQRCISASANRSLASIGDGTKPPPGSGFQSYAIEVVNIGIGIANVVTTRHEITAGQTELLIEIEPSGVVSSGEIGYLLTTYDTVRKVRETEAQLRKATGTDSFTLRIPTGIANPSSSNPGDLSVDVQTSIGGFTLNLLPQRPVGGVYTGSVRVAELANASLPLDVELVTVPADADLANASEAWLLLPVRDDALFAPHRVVANGPDAVASPLVFNSFTQSWVATFSHSFELADDGPFGGLASSQIERTLRFEITAADSRVSGKLSDRWTGLYDKRSAAGIQSLADVVFQGEFDLGRAGDPRQTLPEVAVLTSPASAQREAPSLAACASVSLSATPIDVGGTTYSCAIADIAAFEASSDSEEQIECAIAMSETALAGTTVAGQLQDFISGAAVGQSFSDFMDDCAANTAGTCVPAEEVLCSRQLLAFAYAGLSGTSPNSAQLVDSYQSINKESSLGPQLGAFHNDTQTRLTWLQSQNFPALVTAAVKNHSASLLNDWRDNVLEVHLGVLANQFSIASLSVLAHESEDAVINDTRELMLLGLSQSWRASADAVALAASRWSDLFQDSANRTTQATYVREKLFDLYVMSGVLAELNSQAGAGFASAAFAGGFANIATELQELGQPFSSLVFARDSEVVVSTSLDPTMNNDTVLATRRAAAMTDLARAAESVNTTLADVQQDLVDEATLRGRVQSQIDAFYSELVEVCGVPVGCSVADRSPECRPRTEAGQCGFGLSIDLAGEISEVTLTSVTPSEANTAILEYYSALQDRALAKEEAAEHRRATARYSALTDAFDATIEDWNTRRGDLDTKIDDKVAEATTRQEAALVSLAAFVMKGRDTRDQALLERELWRSNWSTYESEVAGDVTTLIAASDTAAAAAGLAITAETLGLAADALFGGAGASGTPQIGLAVAGAAAQAVGAVFNIAAGVTQVNSDILAASVEQSTLSREFAMSLDDFTFNLQVAEREDQLANIEADMEVLATESDFRDGLLQAIIEDLEGGLADELAYERDIVELNDRRNELSDRTGQQIAFNIRVAQSELTVLQRLLAYAQVVQRGALIDGQLQALEVQSANINALLGSPNVVFSWANRLSQAENRLERAKGAMMEWLIALEYLAVRPFLDARIQILLARNTFQLDKIAGELDRLQSACGGPLNTTNVSVSVRSDLMGIDRGIIDAQGDTLSAEERFREVLTAGIVPIDKRVRYSSDLNIGDLVAKRDVLAATFDINLTDFANLASSCNAKVASVAIELVGTDLGTGRPTVSLLYDGASSVRSCQPNIDALVETIGRDATTFGAITTFRAAGRSVSPVAGIGEAGSLNQTLQGLPLASQYTVLIDTEIGENGAIDWSKLDDIVLHIDFVSQDVFPAGQCE